MRLLRLASSKPAQKAYINTVLFVTTSGVLLALASFAYVAFYLNFIPNIGIERSVHLQYGYGRPWHKQTRRR
jgi:hypothetical protein